MGTTIAFASLQTQAQAEKNADGWEVMTFEHGFVTVMEPGGSLTIHGISELYGLPLSDLATTDDGEVLDYKDIFSIEVQRSLSHSELATRHFSVPLTPAAQAFQLESGDLVLIHKRQTGSARRGHPLSDTTSTGDRPKRSPYPQESEIVTRPIEADRLDGGEAEVAPPEPAVATGETVPWDQAKLHVGKVITVQGKIVNTYNHRGEVCFLNFDTDWRDKFYIPIFQKAFRFLPEEPQDYYMNKTIRVTGEVTLHKGRPNIEVRDLDQIEIVE
jgi:hypothetical protein